MIVQQFPYTRCNEQFGYRVKKAEPRLIEFDPQI